MSVVDVTTMLRSRGYMVYSLCYKIGSTGVTRCEIVLQDTILL